MSREHAAWEEKLQLAQDTTNKAARLELSRSYSSAFAAYVRAGELYLWLVRNINNRNPRGLGSSTTEAELRDRLRKAAAKVLERAERIKQVKSDVRPVERHTLSEEEQSHVLASSSTINSLSFPLWSADPPVHEFELGQNHEYFTDPDPQPALSPSQISHSGAYQRQRPTLGSHASSSVNHSSLFDHHRPLAGRDIVQDVVTDCSFVAALAVAAEHDRKWGTKLASSALYPKDADGRPCASANGKYAVKLYINGAPRKVVIDDALPVYSDGRLMCASSREGNQLWPALIEKAYLKVMGGYDFLGSNSSIDLHALTAWIPEHIFLQHAGFQREKTWARLWEGWRHGECLVTAGTGQIQDEAANVYGLIPTHDYAILEMRETDSHRHLLLMNPWRRSSNVRHSRSVLGQEGWTADVRSALEQNESTGQNIFLISWDDLCSHFDSIYLNWSPDLFAHSLTIHSTWRAAEVSETESGKSVGQNPQFRLALKAGGLPSGEPCEVWLHLVRHAKSKDAENEFMALHVFEHDEAHRLYKPRSGRKLGTYIDGTHNLVRFTATGAEPSYTVVVSRHGPKADVSYSLAVYSAAQLSLHELPHAYPYHEKIAGAWLGRSAGGNVTYSTFMDNPQYKVTISPSASSPTSSVLLLLEAIKELPVQVKLVWSGGKRVAHCVEGDIVANSGMYNHGIAVCERGGLEPGIYTLVLSTFEPGQEGPFAVTVECSSPIKIEPIPQEGAGMFHRTFRGSWRLGSTAAGGPSNGNFEANPRYLINVVRPSLFQIRLLSMPRASGSRPYTNLALFSASASANSNSSESRHGPVRISGRDIASSGPYADHVCGVTIEGARLDAGKYVLVASTFAPGLEGDFQVFVYSDAPLDVSRVEA